MTFLDPLLHMSQSCLLYESATKRQTPTLPLNIGNLNLIMKNSKVQALQFQKYFKYWFYFFFAN